MINISKKYDKYIRAIAHATGDDMLVAEGKFNSDVTGHTHYSPTPIPEEVAEDYLKDIRHNYAIYKQERE